MLSQPDQRTAEGKRDGAVLALMLTTGLRKAELCSLKVSSIKEYRNQKVLDVIGKGHKFRRIALRPDVYEMITKYHKAIGNGHDPESPLFFTLNKNGLWGKRGLTFCAVDFLVRKYAGLAMIQKRVTPHTMRHTFATTLLGKGVDLKTVSELCGHSNMQVTEVYCHSSEDRKFEAVWKLNFN